MIFGTKPKIDPLYQAYGPAAGFSHQENYDVIIALVIFAPLLFLAVLYFLLNKKTKVIAAMEEKNIIEPERKILTEFSKPEPVFDFSWDKNKMQEKIAPIGFIILIIYGLFVVAAIGSGFREWMDLTGLITFPLAAFSVLIFQIISIPLAIYAAVDVWSWNWLVSILVFGFPLIVGFLIMGGTLISYITFGWLRKRA